RTADGGREGGVYHAGYAETEKRAPERARALSVSFDTILVEEHRALRGTGGGMGNGFVLLASVPFSWAGSDSDGRVAHPDHLGSALPGAGDLGPARQRRHHLAHSRHSDRAGDGN